MKKLINLLTVVTTTLLVSGCGEMGNATKSYNEGINIIPVPKELTINEGRFMLDSKTKFVVDQSDANAPKVADYFIHKINKSTGYNIVSTKENLLKNVIKLNISGDSKISKEGYILKVTPDLVDITASTAQGLYYGMQSFLQLLPAEIESHEVVKGVNWSAQAVEINDEPRFKYRGMMLDATRHFSSVEDVKRQIDILTMFKINVLHWHLTDDQLWTVEVKKYPKLTEIGSNRLEGEGTYHKGFYTQEDMKEVVAYATERFVEVIPEIEMPGHGLAALTAYPELSCTGGPFAIRNVWGVEADVFCAGNEDTFKFLEDVLTEIIPIFPSEYIHIGGDECPKDRWDECPKCKARMKTEKLKDSHELQSYFVKRMEKFINSKGKKIIGWDEILEGGIAPNATIMSWRGETGGIAAANAGHDVIMTPNTYVYLDYYQGNSNVEPVGIGGYLPLEKTYSFNPTPADIAEDKAHHVIGAQGNVWAEYLYEPKDKEYMAYPRMLAVAEIGWSPQSKKDFADFSRRINNAYVRMDALDVNYHIPLPMAGESKYVAFLDSTKLEFTNLGSYPMVYTLDGSEPTSTSTVYSEPLSFTDNATVKIATLLQSGKLSNVITYTVAKEQLSPATDVQTTAGFTKKVVDGHFLNREAYSKAKFSEPEVVTDFTKFKEFDHKKPSVEIYEGYFNAPEDGVYTIATDNVELYIDDKLVVDNDNKVSKNLIRKTTKALAAGKHKFRMVMNNSVFGGWPYSWSHNTFYLKAPSQEKLTKVEASELSH